jgi:hypothetical protein
MNYLNYELYSCIHSFGTSIKHRRRDSVLRVERRYKVIEVPAVTAERCGDLQQRTRYNRSACFIAVQRWGVAYVRVRLRGRHIVRFDDPNLRSSNNRVGTWVA